MVGQRRAMYCNSTTISFAFHGLHDLCKVLGNTDPPHLGARACTSTARRRLDGQYT